MMDSTAVLGKGLFLFTPIVLCQFDSRFVKGVEIDSPSWLPNYLIFCMIILLFRGIPELPGDAVGVFECAATAFVLVHHHAGDSELSAPERTSRGEFWGTLV